MLFQACTPLTLTQALTVGELQLKGYRAGARLSTLGTDEKIPNSDGGHVRPRTGKEWGYLATEKPTLCPELGTLFWKLPSTHLTLKTPWEAGINTED